MIRLAFALLPVLSLHAAAQELQRAPRGVLLPGIGENDPRRRVDAAQMPWRALGRVQLDVGGRCTGVLIAPDRVLTAAHCLVGPRSGNFVRPGTVNFLLGYANGEWVAAAKGASYVTGPAFVPGLGPASADWAVLTLGRPINAPDRVLPLIREPPPPRTPIMLGGYQQDRPEVIMADTDCRLVGVQRHPDGGRTVVHDCAGTRGSSGAPLLARMPDGRWGVIGVQSATSPDIALGHAALAGVVGEGR